MVAMVSGNGFGLFNGSAGVLGQQGLFGNATLGTAKEGAYVNVFNGNLTLQNTDDFLASRGINVAFTRTYNAQGTFNDGNGANWLTGVARLTALPASPNTAGSTVTRIAADGSTSIFTYDASRNAYVSSDGAGAYQTLTYAGGQWTWKSGQTGSNGLYETYDQTTGRLSATGDQLGIRTKYYYNATGRLSQITDSAGSTGKAGAQTSNTVNDQTYFDYDAGGKLTQIRQVLASGGGTTVRTHYEYDTQDRLSRVVTDLTPTDAKITDNNVYAVSYTYDGTSNRIASVSQSDGTQLFFEYDEDGWVKKFTERATGQVDRVTTLAHTTLGDGTRQTSVTDGLNHTTTYYTDAQGQLVRVESPSQSIAFGYNDKGDVISTTDTLGRVTTFEYDANGNCIRQTDPAGNVIERTYSAANPAAPTTDPGNRLLTETVIAAGADRLTQSQTTRYVYEADAGLTARLRFVISPQGRVTEYTYDSLGQRSSEWTFNANAYAIDGLAPETVPTEAQLVAWIATSAVDKAQITRTDYAYNLRGQVATSTTYVTATTTSVTATNAVVKNYTYDPAGNLLTVSGSGTVSTTYKYDGLGRLELKTDPNGTTTYTYQANSTTTRTVDPSGLVTEKVYDAAGRLVSVTQSEGTLTSTMRNVYDAAGRLRMTVDAAGRKTVLLYDDAGRKVAEVGPDGAVTEYVYDAGNQPINTIRYLTPIAQSALLTGDTPRDDVTISAIRPSATAFDHKTWTQYDALGRVTATVDAERYLTRYVYDVNGHLVSTIQRAKQLTAAQLAAGIPAQAAAEASADDRITRALYNADGLLVAKLDALGYLTENVYDAGGRLVDTIAYATATAASARAAGDLATLRPATTAADIRNHFVYDNAGRLVASVDGDNYVTEVIYDANGDVQRRIRYATASTTPYVTTLAGVKAGTSASNADNRITTYTYNTLKQLVTESTTNSSGTVIGTSITYTYDKQGNVTSVARANGSTRISRYDDLGRLIAEAPAAGMPETVYTYDAAGRRVSMTDANGNRTLYFYDPAGRLTYTVNALGEVAEKTYDAFGQVIAERLYGTRVDAALLAGGDAAGVRALVQPATTDPRTFYYYDKNGRLVYTVNGTGDVAAQGYDAFGGTIASTRYTARLSGGTLGALTGGVPSSQLLAELAGNAAQTTSYAYDADGRLTYTINALGEAQSRGYDAFDNVVQTVQYAQRNITDLVGGAQDSVTSTIYDKRGNAVAYVDASGNTIATTYNAYSQATSVKSAGTFVNGSAVVQDTIARTIYDTDGRVIATIDGAGAVTVLTYDGNNNVTERVTYATPISAASAAAATAANVRTIATANTALDARQRYFYDAAGRLTATLTASAASAWTVQTVTYDAYGNVFERRTYATSLAAATPTAGSIATWTAANGAATDAVERMAYDGANRLIAKATRQTAGTWSVAGVRYDAAGRVVAQTAYANTLRVTDPTAAQISAIAVSAFDAVTLTTYDAAGRAIATATAQNVTEAGVITWALVRNEYDGLGHLTARTAYATPLQSNTPPSDLRDAVMATAGDRTTRYYYDAAGRVTLTVDPLGAAVGTVYDAKGNVAARIAYANPAGTTGAAPVADAARDRVTRIVRDLANRLDYEIDPTGAVTERRYDALGNLVAEVRYATPIAGALSESSQGADVRALLKADAANDRVERRVYDQAGRVRFAVDAAGYFTENRYDALGRVVATLKYQTLVSASDTDLAAKVTAAAAAQAASSDTTLRPRSTTYAYDAAGNVLSTTDALNNTESYTYDAAGRKLTFKNKLGNVWQYTYDAAGHLLQETAPQVAVYTDGTSVAPGAWGAGTLTALTTRFEYDMFGNLTRRTEGIGGGQERSTEYVYDLAGRQTGTRQSGVQVYDAASDPKNWFGAAATYETFSGALYTKVAYNVFGEAVSNRDVGGKMSYKVYDQRGQVAYELDAAGFVTGYQRNAFGDVVALTRYGNAWAGANKTPVGEMTAAQFAAGLRPNVGADRALFTSYDRLGRAIRTSEPIAPVYDTTSTQGTPYLDAGKVTETSYNAFGDIVRVSSFGMNPLGYAVTAATETVNFYDMRGLKTAQVDKVDESIVNGQAQRKGYLTTFRYDAAGNLTQRTEHAGAIAAWSAAKYDTPAAADADRTTIYAYDGANRMVSETRVGVSYYNGTTATRGNLGTAYEYDKLGNRTAVTDALNNKVFTYYDALGRVRATAQYRASASAAAVPFTEYKLDAYGNTVLRIDYADGAPAGLTAAAVPVATAAMIANTANRVTATTYDSAGRAIATLDPEQFSRAKELRSAVSLSYDIYGHVARKAQTVRDIYGNTHLQFEVTSYDALGRVASVETPGNLNMITNEATINTVRSTQYNAFGEAIATSYKDAKGEHPLEETRYDQAGRAWLTNAGDGVYKVMLYDALGRVSAQIVSTATDPRQLASLTSASEALTLPQVQRTDIRYDLMGRKVDVRQDDGLTYVLARDAQSGIWRAQPARGSATAPLLVVGQIGEDPATIRVLYRMKGSTAWTDDTAARVRAYGEYTGFNTAGLASGEYEYKLVVQPAGEPAYERTGGTFTAVATETRDLDMQLARLYAVVLNRAADLAGLNHFVTLANQGYPLPELVAHLLGSDEGKALFTGTGTEIMRRILRDAFGRDGQNDPAYAADLASWSRRYDAAPATPATARAQVLLELVDSVAGYQGDAAALKNAKARLENRAQAALSYALDYQGTDPADAATIFQLAATDSTAALAKAHELGTIAQRRTQIAQLYLTLFGRAPELGGMNAWLASMAAGLTIEQVAQGLLDSVEAQDPLLYPSAGLTTAQYNDQLVRRVYQNMLGRAATPAELTDWLGRLNGGQITRGQFALQLAQRVNTYGGNDAAALADRKLFANRTSIALSFAQQPLTGIAPADYGSVSKALIASITSGDSAQAAANAALTTSAANATVAAALKAAATAAAQATPLEDMRIQLSRLYVALLNRTPDSAGFNFQLGQLTSGNQGGPDTGKLVGIAYNFISGPEAAADPSLLSDPQLTPLQFVQRIYTLALGDLPTSAGATAEIAAFAALLPAHSRAEVALAVVNGMMRYDGMTTAEAQLKARFDNKVAVGVACAVNLGAFDWAGNGNIQVARAVLGRVTTNDTTGAITYAYQQAQSAFMATAQASLAAATQARGAALSAADANNAAAAASAAAKSAAAAAAGQPDAATRLRIMQMYVGLLGRDEAYFRNNPDLDGFNFQVSQTATYSMALMAQGFIDSNEGKALYQGETTNAGFVRKVFATILKGATVAQADIDSWAAKMEGSAPLSRGQIALGILESVTGYANYTPDSAAAAYLTARSAFMQRVSGSFAVLDTAQQAAAASAMTKLAEYQQVQRDLQALVDAKNAAASAQSTAAQAATTALNSASNAGDGSAARRLQVTRLYATLLQRTDPPALSEITFHAAGGYALDVIAQAMITGSEAQQKGLYPADNTAFVTKLFSFILGRQPDAGDDLTTWTRQLAAGTATRGKVALDLLNAYVNYSDAKPEQLSRKLAFDTKIDTFLAAQKRETDAAYDSAKAISDQRSTEANSLYSAFVSAQSLRDQRQAELNTANTNAGYAQKLLNNTALSREVIEAQMAVRGYTDIPGIAVQVNGLAAGSFTIERVINDLLEAQPYPSDTTAFVVKLYSQILGRTASSADIDHWVQLINSGQNTRAYVAFSFIRSDEGQKRLKPIVDSRLSSDQALARQMVSAQTTAQTNYNSADTAYQSALTKYNTAKSAYDTAAAVTNTANNVRLATTSLTSAHAKVYTATQAYVTAANARVAYDAKKAVADAMAASVPAWQAMQRNADGTHAAAGLAAAGAQVGAADAGMASVYVSQAAMPSTTRNAMLVAQLYTALMNRAPLLTEMALWSAQLNNGATLAAVAQQIMASPAAAALYPGGQTDAAFVTQLFRFGLGRDFSNDPVGLSFWTGKLTGTQAITRAQLVAEWIASVPRNGNGDSATFHQRTAAALQSVVDAGASSDLMPAVRLAEQIARDAATAYDRTAAATMAATQDAALIKPLTQLYVTLLGRAPDAVGIASWLKSINLTGISLATMAEGMITSVEGSQLYPAGQGDTAFVTQVLGRILGRAPSQAELAPYLAKAAAGRGQAVLEMIGAYANGTDGGLEQIVQRQRFNAQVAEALTALQSEAASYATVTRQADSTLQLLAQSGNVERYATQVVLGNVTSVQAAGKPVFTGNQMTLDRWGNVLAVTDPRDPNWKITYTYNHDNQQLTQTALGVQGKVSPIAASRYDALGRTVGTVDGNGNLTQYGYDVNGNMVLQTNPDGGTVTNTYNLFGDRLSVRRSLTATTGLQMNYTYDHMGRLLQTQTSAAVEVWKAVNQGLETLDAKLEGTRALVETYTYDELGRRITTSNAAGEVTKQEYDAGGNVISTFDAYNYRSLFSFDALGHRTGSKDELGNGMRWEYDAFGRMTAQYDMSGIRTSFTYDAAGRKIAQQSEGGQNMEYIYTNGLLTLVIDHATHAVTGYQYDRAGNRIREQQAFQPEAQYQPTRVQNNRITYDELNRITSIKDDVYELQYTYDGNGNRTSVTTTYGATTFTAWNTYDSMNRQLIVNGDKVGGTIVYGEYGHRLTYDLAGNRTSDTFKGAKVTLSGSTYSATGGQETVETYKYDAAGRLAETKRDVLVIDTRRYDAAGRLSASGMLAVAAMSSTLKSSVDKIAKTIGTVAETRTYSYNPTGAMTRQKARTLDGSAKDDTYFDYDKVGRLTGYTAIDPSSGKNIQYTITYALMDGYKESSVSVSGGGTTFSTYDANGNRVELTEGSKVTKYAYDAEGHVQSKLVNGVLSFSLIANGEVLGTETETRDNFLGSTYTGVTAGNMTAAPSAYAVQNANETLQGIARAVWGDAGLWYLIADANGLDSDAKLTVGQTLRIPARVNTVHGGYDTFKPYNEAEAIGSTAPAMPQPKRGGCGGLGQLVMVVVAVVATVVTAGAASFALAAALGPVGGAIATGAIAGAVGSVASQVVGIAIGAQDGFNWKGVATAALGGAITGGVTSLANTGILPEVFQGQSWQATAARAALSNTVSQGIGVVTGLQKSFDWRGVAASAAGAAANTQAGNYLNGSASFNNAFGQYASIAKDTLSGMASGTTASVVRGGKIDLVQIATDAFGNAIGSSLAQTIETNAKARQAEEIRRGGAAALAQHFAKSGMSQGQIDALMAEDSVQGLLASNARMLKAEAAAGIRLEDMSLEEQAAAIGRRGVVRIELGGEVIVDSEAQRQDGLMRKVVGGAADVLEFANDSVSKLVDAMGGERNAQFVVFGLQALMGGVPKALTNLALGEASNALFGDIRNTAVDTVGAMIGKYAFNSADYVDNPSAGYANDVQAVSRAMADFGIASIVDSARGVLGSSYRMQMARTRMAGPTPEIGSRLATPTSPTGHPVLAQVEYGSPGGFIVEGTKPSMKGRLVETHSYENPGHHDPKGGLLKYNTEKSVLPDNHVELFSASQVFTNAEGKMLRYAREADGTVHRFEPSVKGFYHWSGSTSGVTLGGQLRSLPVPNDIRRMLNGN